jgi:signal peptidase I
VTLYWAFRFFVAVDAARTARAAPATYAPRRFNRWYLYVACFLLLGWAHLWTVFHAGVGMFYLPTVAMAQTLVPGDTLLVDRLAYGLPLPLTDDEAFRYADPERGHVVVYRITDARGVPQVFMFRVLGVPGDELESRAGQLFVNGAPHNEPYLHLEGSPQEDFGPITVPGASYFVLGDNRNRSRDSRYADYRFVRRSQILGRVRTVLFSVDPYTGGLRPDRLGAVIR